MSKILPKNPNPNSRRPWTVRTWNGPAKGERSFATRTEAEAYKHDVDKAARYSSPKVLVLSAEATEIPVHGAIFAIYRLWDSERRCLYVGKSTQVHPILRVMDHRHKTWWNEVKRADFIVVTPESLDQAEMDQIRELMPVHNQIRRRWAAA